MSAVQSKGIVGECLQVHVLQVGIRCELIPYTCTATGHSVISFAFWGVDRMKSEVRGWLWKATIDRCPDIVEHLSPTVGKLMKRSGTTVVKCGHKRN